MRGSLHGSDSQSSGKGWTNLNRIQKLKQALNQALLLILHKLQANKFIIKRGVQFIKGNQAYGISA